MSAPAPELPPPPNPSHDPIDVMIPPIVMIVLSAMRYFLRIFRIFAIQAAELYLPFPPLPLVALRENVCVLPACAASTRFFSFFFARPLTLATACRVTLEPRRGPPPLARENRFCTALDDWPMPEIPERPRRGICGIRFYSLVGLVE